MGRKIEPLLDHSLSEEDRKKQALNLYFDLYNEGEFFKCHDVMEELWLEISTPERRFYQGLLQCAVSRFHWENGNVHGARILYKEGTRKLDDFRPSYRGVDLEKYLSELIEVLPENVRNPKN